MKFINPKTDYAFKKIFGSDQIERERIGAIELGKAQERTEGLTQWLTQGRAEGIEIGEQIGEQRGQINLIKRLFQRQLGELNQSIEDSLSQLSSEHLSALAEAIFDFSSVGDLSSWLETNCPN